MVSRVQDDRLRVPIDDPYLHEVGLAVLCFSRLEWDAVWCCEKISPGYIHTVAKKTAGRIADDLIAHSVSHTDQAVSEQLLPAANEFKRLTNRRNDLLHANPATAPNGDQRLFRHGVQWSLSMVSELADEFTACSLILNNCLHILLAD